MKIDQTICYTALKTRDARFDGRFFTGVKSTGIFCRPICPANTPKEENCTFFETAHEALQSGFRPCLRCRPESAPSSPAWQGTAAVVKRALSLIDDGALDHEQSVNDLAERLGLGERQLRRLFKTHLGASPNQVALTRRLLFAKQLLHQCEDSISDIALASGFNSLRRFNDAYKKTFGVAPSQERGQKRKPSSAAASHSLRFDFRPPFDWLGLLDFFAQRSLTGLEKVTPQSYERAIQINDATGRIKASLQSGDSFLRIEIIDIPITHYREVSKRVRLLFDLDCDPEKISTDLSKDPLMAEIISQNPGLRLPGAWDGFEIAVRAVLGQQISLKAARTIGSRLIERCGHRLSDGFMAFPQCQDILSHNLEGLGLTKTRMQTLKNLAEAFQPLERSTPPEETIKRLCAIKGIGPWTAQYIVMRSLGEPDIYPSQDLGLIRAMEKLNPDFDRKDLDQTFDQWRPWRAYAAQHLWRV